MRHDGTHRRDRWLVGELGRFVEWVPVCPELEAGFGVPRPTVRLAMDSDGSVRLVRSSDGSDLTDVMNSFSGARARELAELGLDGYVWKKSSPSCGMERVKVARPDGAQPVDGRGKFVSAVLGELPLLAMEEEGRLNDSRLRDHFLTRIFAARRLRALEESGPVPRDLVEFHASHKYLLLAHDPEGARELGRVVARAGSEWPATMGIYRSGFLQALATPATVGRHVNVLEHLMGVIVGLTPTERSAMHESIAEYRAGHVTRSVPTALIRHALIEHDASGEWASEQVYLDPYPRPLAASRG